VTVAPLPREERDLVEAVSSDALMASTRAIAQWVRLSGTPDEAKAFDWIEQRLRAIGLETARYAHPGLVSWPESASLTLVAGATELTIPCATHGFAASTPPDGLDRDLVYAGRGGDEELRQAGARGKIVLVDGIVAPNRNVAVEAAGAEGSVWIAGARLHERILSPVWGTPTPETAALLPRTPSISVTGAEGARVKALLEQGPVRARLHTRVYRGWKSLPCLTADLRPASNGPEAETFVMLSGHVDSWYYGAMDNGTANATMLEVARLLAGRRGALRRGLRLAFWSGHSHARYGGSAWYADAFWLELHDRCVAHVNVDSVGGRGATVLSEGNSMAELRSFASDAIEQIAGQRLSARRYGRAGDQSFWGHGIPAVFMALSEQPAENADPVLLALHHQISGGAGRSGGLGSWWHTPDDTVDKIDPVNLTRDARIYALVLHRLCAAAVLPLDYSPVVGDLQSAVRELQAGCAGHFDLAPLAAELEALGAEVRSLSEHAAAARRDGTDEDNASKLNRCLVALGRGLIPVDYTRSGQFDHDLAVPTSPLPGLRAAVRLGHLTPGTDEYEFVRTRLLRERNRAVFAVREARRTIQEILATR
jgi:Peptidase family M28